ncbi:MAG: SlyX family protein [Planctomycetota bacterium]
MDADTRLVNIEEKIAHLEQYLGELDGVVREMNDRMDGYQAELTKMRELVESQNASSDDEPGDDGPSDQRLEDERPPHW